MFRSEAQVRSDPGGFPRIRGDVPAVGGAREGDNGFSPHTRGCSGDAAAATVVCNVFPAYAGMFRPLI